MMGQRKILIVEDEEMLLLAIKKKMEKKGFLTCEARSVKAAIKSLAKDKFDAIWLDHYLLGQGNGLDLLQKIKADKKLKKIPVFVISNTVSREKIKKYVKLGAVRYYTKAEYELNRIINYINWYISKK